jgi:hypothetical protein
MSQVFVGLLEDYFETGSEGTHWALIRDLAPGEGEVNYYERLILLQAGDQFTVFERDGSERFTCVIEPDRSIGYTPYERNPDYGQPLALGRWIHWTQKGWQPDDWARLFIPDIDPSVFDAKLLEKVRAEGAQELFLKYGRPVGWIVPNDEYYRFQRIRGDVYDSFRFRGRIVRNG